MNKFILAFVIVIFLGAGYWFLSSQKASVSIPSELNNDNFTSEEIASEPQSTDQQVYLNEEWGFSFKYPKGWSVREPAFVSSVSMLNLAIEPDNKLYPEAILVNITPKEWLDNAHKNMKDRGVVFTDVELSGQQALFAESEEGITGPTDNYYMLVNDKYWIHLSGQKYQIETFEYFLKSFEFITQ